MTTTTAPRAIIDASKLPDSAWDARALLWWGNLLLLFVETCTMVLLFACYFYIRRNFWEWPPPRVLDFPVIGHPVPRLGVATINLLIILASCAPMYWTDQAARRLDRARIVLGLALMLLITILTMWLRCKEFDAFYFKWDENAYGSIVWSMLVMHLFYLFSAAGEFFMMLLWASTHEVDPKHGLDVTLAGGFWYWVAGVWAVAYVILYWYPRWTT